MSTVNANTLLESAMKRRIKTNQSFCNYSFKQITNIFGNSQISINHHVEKNSHLSNVQTSTTLELRKKPSNRSVLQSGTMETEKFKFSNIRHRNNCKKNVNHLLYMEKRNHFYDGDEGDQFEQFEENRKILESRAHPFKPVIKSFEFGEGSGKNKANNVVDEKVIKFDKKTFKEIEVLRNFNCLQFPQLFLSQQNSYNGMDREFQSFFMINLRSKKYFESSITSNSKIFSGLPMKEAALKMNNFSTKIQDGIFYCSFLKGKHQMNRLAYCESFFWISQPIKHTQRKKAAEIIKKFLTSCLIRLESHGKIKNEELFGQKIWIVDSRGVISYIGREKIIDSKFLKVITTRENERTSLGGLDAICLQIFMNSFHKGEFNHLDSSSQNSHEILPF